MSTETQMPHGRPSGKASYEPGDAEHRKAALASALDSCCNVIVETRELVRDASMRWTPGERQNLAVALEGLARVCNSVARECERKSEVKK